MDYQAEIEALKGEVQSINKQLKELLSLKNQKAQNLTEKSDAEKNELPQNGKDAEYGEASCAGWFVSNGRKIEWQGGKICSKELLSVTQNGYTEKILVCIGNNDRLNIILSLLKKPMTVAMLVEECGYNSTGQVYHHLKPLISAELIAECKDSDKGMYMVQPHFVQGIVTLLAAVSSMIEANKNKQAEPLALHGGAKMVDERYSITKEESDKIMSIVFESLEPLRLKMFPVKEKKKVVILNKIAEQFEKNRKYTEKEVNAIIKEIYSDYVTLRRYLIEYGYMSRTNDCSEYWMN